MIDTEIPKKVFEQTEEGDLMHATVYDKSWSLDTSEVKEGKIKEPDFLMQRTLNLTDVLDATHFFR